MERSSLVGIGIGIVLLVLIIFGYTWWQNRPEYEHEEKTESGVMPGGAPPSVQSTPPAPNPSPAPLNAVEEKLAKDARYTQALNTYDSLVQITNCRGQVYPGVGILYMKKGMHFLLDNRDKMPHTFVIESQTVRVGMEDFAIIEARDIGEYFITCDGGSAAKLNVHQ